MVTVVVTANVDAIAPVDSPHPNQSDDVMALVDSPRPNQSDDMMPLVYRLPFPIRCQYDGTSRLSLYQSVLRCDGTGRLFLSQ